MLLCRSTTTASGGHGEHLWLWAWWGRDMVDMVGRTQEEDLGHRGDAEGGAGFR